VQYFFVQYTLSAGEMCRNDKKLTISAEHVVKGLEELEFPFVDKLNEFLTLYKMEQANKKVAKLTTQQNTMTTTTTATEESNDDLQAPAKKQKLDPDSKLPSEEKKSMATETMEGE
jgi:hypothetical protein